MTLNIPECADFFDWSVTKNNGHFTGTIKLKNDTTLISTVSGKTLEDCFINLFTSLCLNCQQSFFSCDACKNFNNFKRKEND